MPTSDLPGDNLGDGLMGKAGFPSSQLSVETLALLHVDALEGIERDRAKAAAAADPAAQAVLAGLDMVCEQLRRLDQVSAPSEPMPEFVARRLDRELAKLSGAVDGQRRRWATAASVGSVAAAAAVLSLVTYVAWPRPGQSAQQPASQAKSSPATQGAIRDKNEALIVDKRFKIERKDFSTLLNSGSSFKDLGPLSDDATRADCLVANGFPSNQQLVAAGRIRRDDKEGIFMMIPTPSQLQGGAPEMTVLVVGVECRAGVPATLSKQVLSKN